MREWRLLFTLSTDGESLQTFHTKLKNRDHTVILV
jgi:hypothetical protein